MIIGCLVYCCDQHLPPMDMATAAELSENDGSATSTKTNPFYTSKEIEREIREIVNGV